MPNHIQQLIKSFAENPKKLFLLDGLGALLTAFLLSFVLSNLEQYFGMPQDTLFCLSLIALVFAVYSITCTYLLKRNQTPFLYLIATANTLYCILTLGLISHFYDQLTVWDILYFLVEISIVGLLVFIEQQTAKKLLTDFKYK